MKVGDQNLYRTLKNQAVRRVLQDNKVPGTSVGTREATAPGSEFTGSALEFLRESQVNGSLHCQTRFEENQKGPGCLKSQMGNREEVANTQGLYVPTKTVDSN